MFRVVFNHILPFVSAMFVGIAVVYVGAFYLTSPFDVPVPNASGTGTVFYGPGGVSCWRTSKGDGTGSATTSKLSIISKPAAAYTDEARVNEVEGTVRLKVTMLASGDVGSITPVTRLPHGLTEQAVAAARKIEFEPKKVNGVPVSTVVTVEYSFEIY